MPPTWVLIVAPTGVLAIVLLTWCLGGRFSKPITWDWLERFLECEEPPQKLLQACIGIDGRSALVFLEHGKLGVVAQTGDGLSFRRIENSAAIVRTSAGLRIRLPGVTFPSVVVRCSEHELPASIKEALTRLETFSV